MTLPIFFSLLGTAIYLIGFVPYIYHVFHGKVVPHPFTWTIGCILLAINAFALFEQEQAFDFILLVPGTRLIALSIGAIIGWVMLSKISVTRFDYLCLVLAFFCLIVGYQFGVSHAIIPTIALDIFALTPTLRKIWNDPDSEDAFTWILTVFSQACILLSLGTYTLDTTLFWAYTMTVNLLVALFIYRRKLTVHHWKYLITKSIDFFALKKNLW